MTLKVIDAGPGPRTHALVIGIGGYEHLKGGEGTPLPNLLQYGSLGQLTSPRDPRWRLAMRCSRRLLIGKCHSEQSTCWSHPRLRIPIHPVTA